MICQISRVGLSLMYMQHMHIIFGEFHRHHYLLLYQNTSDNYYSSPLRHKVWNVEHNRVCWELICVTIYSHIFVWNIRIILNMILSVCSFSSYEFFLQLPWSITPFLQCYFVVCCWNYLAKLTSLFWLPVCIWICESNLLDPGSWTLDINWYIYISSTSLSPYTTYLPYSDALMPRSIITE